MSTSQQADKWDLIIQSKSSLFDLKLREVWRYRDLLLMFVKRDFISFYKQTVLGPLWIFIQPIFTTLVYTFVFGNLANIGTDGIPQPLFYLCGITAWNYFADCLNKTSTVFSDNSKIFGKVYFPRLIMPLSIVVSNLVRFGVQMGLLIAMMIYFTAQGTSLPWSWDLLLLPVLILLMAMMGLGIGLIITALTTKYRDLTFLVSFGVSLMMYATTVVYPLSEARARFTDYAWIIELNPMTYIIEGFRHVLLGEGVFSLQTLGYSAAVATGLMLVGLLIFNRTERTFVDTI